MGRSVIICVCVYLVLVAAKKSKESGNDGIAYVKSTTERIRAETFNNKTQFSSTFKPRTSGPRAVGPSTFRSSSVGSSAISSSSVGLKTFRSSTAGSSTCTPPTVGSNVFRPSIVKTSTVRISSFKPSTVKTSTFELSTVKTRSFEVSTVKTSTLKPSNVEASTIGRNTSRSGTLGRSTVKSRTLGRSTARSSTTRRNTIRSSTTRRSTVRTSTARQTTGTSNTTRSNIFRSSTLISSTLSSSTSSSFADYMANIEKVDASRILQPGVLIERQSGNVPRKNVDAPDRGFPSETQRRVAELHNMYRMNATPPAANMNFLEWDDELAYYAQLWSDRCVFAHGFPPGTQYSQGPYGQNLYLGADPTGYNGLWMFYEEYQHYDMRRIYCKPREQCGHYEQMLWGWADRVGCGVKNCGQYYLMTCHYFPPAIEGKHMYKIGEPCTQCGDGRGARCFRNLCLTAEQCKRNDFECSEARCTLICKNCGILNETSCSCKCADGWDSMDCSRPCKDEHSRCHVAPGFPDATSCWLNNYLVRTDYCRKMCGMCNPLDPDRVYSHHCCNGRKCPDGYVLDNLRKPCRCALLCPGPKCNGRANLNCNTDHVLGTMFVLCLLLLLNVYFYF